MIVLSTFQLKPVLQAKAQGAATVVSSTDLGLSEALFHLTAQHVRLPDGQQLTWAAVARIAANETACYMVQENEAQKIQFYSDLFSRAYSLMPTAMAPTMLISGIPMHRIKDMDPYRDARNKAMAGRPMTGEILDTTMGLGYTAIQASEVAEHVTVIELDEVVVEVCRHNPWSAGLFDNPRITRLIGDSADVVTTFADGRFQRIVHDPPTFSLAGHLYATEFYKECYRVLASRGRFFHYIGNPQSKSGAAVTRGVVRRLKEANFKRVVSRPEAFGVLAYK